MSAEKKVIVTQIRSSAGRLKSHKSCLRGLGLRELIIQVVKTHLNRGMINSFT